MLKYRSWENPEWIAELRYRAQDCRTMEELGKRMGMHEVSLTRYARQSSEVAEIIREMKSGSCSEPDLTLAEISSTVNAVIHGDDLVRFYFRLFLENPGYTYYEIAWLWLTMFKGEIITDFRGSKVRLVSIVSSRLNSAAKKAPLLLRVISTLKANSGNGPYPEKLFDIDRDMHRVQGKTRAQIIDLLRLSETAVYNDYRNDQELKDAIRHRESNTHRGSSEQAKYVHDRDFPVIQKLVKEKKSFPEIARTLGYKTESGFRHAAKQHQEIWAITYGTPRTRKLPNPLACDREKHFIVIQDVIAAGGSNQEAAAACGFSPQALCRYFQTRPELIELRKQYPVRQKQLEPKYDRTECINMLRSGASIAKIVKRLGVSHGLLSYWMKSDETIKQAAAEGGIAIHEVKPESWWTAPETLFGIAAMLRQGKTITDICESFNVSSMAFKQHISVIPELANLLVACPDCGLSSNILIACYLRLGDVDGLAQYVKRCIDRAEGYVSISMLTTEKFRQKELKRQARKHPGLHEQLNRLARPKETWTREELQTVTDMVASGESDAAIMRRFGMPDKWTDYLMRISEDFATAYQQGMKIKTKILDKGKELQCKLISPSKR